MKNNKLYWIISVTAAVVIGAVCILVPKKQTGDLTLDPTPEVQTYEAAAETAEAVTEEKTTEETTEEVTTEPEAEETETTAESETETTLEEVVIEIGVGDIPEGGMLEDDPPAAGPAPTQAPTAAPADPQSVAPGAMTYEQYSAMSGEDRDAYFKSFESQSAFLAWYNAAKAAYDAANPPIIVEPGVVIDLGE